MTTYFIHGFLEDNSMWDSIVIPPDLRPVFIELPGHGKRLMEVCPTDMNEMARSILPLFTDAPFQIIGHSMGGYLIGSLIENGLRPQRIGLFHSKLGEDHPDKKAQRLRAMELVKENKSLYIHTMITNLFSPSLRVELEGKISSLIESAQSISVETIIHCHHAMLHRTSGIALVHQLSIPTFYFAGMEDQSVPLDQIQSEVSALAPIAAVTVQPQLGHMGQWESPSAVQEWLQLFV
jgi:pimeloyl-ACP methyl ester carboxylesterase